jgi:CRISPR-associated endoribonuclease Cas6
MDLKKGDKRTLVVSSPDDLFIKRLREVFLKSKRSNKKAKVGRMSFMIDNISLLEYRLNSRDLNLITGTPIVVRMQKDRCKEYGIKLDKDYDYVYWRKEYPLSAFIKQIEDNLIKKYIEFYNETPNSNVFPLIQMLTFRKQISTRLHFEEGTQIVIGTTWEFHFRGLNDNQIRFLEFGMDAGFGEMNSRGFGFMNLAKGNA